MPLTVFEVKGIPALRRERIEAAVEAAGKHLSAPYEAWITTDPFRGGVQVLITGPHGFERMATFALNEEPGCDHGADQSDDRKLIPFRTLTASPLCTVGGPEAPCGVLFHNRDTKWIVNISLRE